MIPLNKQNSQHSLINTFVMLLASKYIWICNQNHVVLFFSVEFLKHSKVLKRQLLSLFDTAFLLIDCIYS